MENFYEHLEKMKEASNITLIDTGKKPAESICRIYEQFTEILTDLHLIWGKKVAKSVQKKRQAVLYEVRKNTWLAGGSASEVCIEGYEQPPKDADIFVSESALHEPFTPIEEEVEGKTVRFVTVMKLLNERGKFTQRKNEKRIQSQYGDDSIITTIIEGCFDEYPEQKVEIIVQENLNFNFDLGFREFFYNGNNILATNHALQDIADKKIRFRRVYSPYSSLLRADQFANRYGYAVDEFTRKWVLKAIRYQFQQRIRKSDTLAEFIEEKVDLVQKYKTNFNIEQLIKEIEQTVLNETEQEILRIFETEDVKEDLETPYFVRVIERLRYAEQQQFDWEQKNILEAPSIIGNSSGLRTEEGESLLPETKEEIRKSLNRAIRKQQRENKLRSIFDENVRYNQSVEATLRSESYRIGYEENLKLHKTSAELELMLLEIDALKEEQTVSDWSPLVYNREYFGSKKEAFKKIKADKMYLRPSKWFVLFSPLQFQEDQQFNFSYLPEGPSVKLSFSPEEEMNFLINKQEFQFLTGDRKDKLKKTISAGVKQLQQTTANLESILKMLEKATKLDATDRTDRYALKRHEVEEIKNQVKKQNLIFDPFLF